jgi:hypothetical protein
MEIMLRRDDLALRWFDGRSALIFPVEGQVRMIVPAIAPLDGALEPIVRDHTSTLHTEHMRPDDLTPRFDVHLFDAEGALAAYLPSVQGAPAYWSASEAFPADAPLAVYEPLALPADLGGVVELLGYEVRTPTVRPGAEVELLTAWRVRASLADEAVLFTHALDHGGHVVGQVDRLDVPSWAWRQGDVFVQLHRFPIDGAVAPDLVHLEVGFYTREDQNRVPVLVEGTPVDDRILLSPIEVTAP